MATSKMHMGGRHSRACLNCRIRRIKCDFELPACSQCLRARKTCSGYRDEQALMFRDGGKKIAQGVKGSNQLPNEMLDHDQRQSSSSGEVGSAQFPKATPSAEYSTAPSPLGQPSISSLSLDKGIEFFYDNYITFISSTATGRAALPTSPAWNFLFTNPAYSSACSAAGYAGLSNVTGDSGHMVAARKQYALSLQSIESTLQDKSSLAMSFESVLILTVFEIVNAGSWGVHVQGAAAIWKMMAAHDQAPSPRTQVYSVFIIFMKCLISEEPSPPGMEVWSQQVQKQMRSDDAVAAPLAYTASRFVDLYASVRSGRTVDPKITIHQAKTLDAELVEWEQTLPPRWHFTEEISDNALYAFHNKTHKYHDFWIARMLSNYRWVRILINNLILLHLPSSSSDRISPMSTITRLSTDICHSLSYFFEPCIIEEGQIAPFPVLAGCLVILFPLAVVGCAVGVPDEMHNWAIDQLDMIGGRMGIRSATRLIGVVSKLRKEWAVHG
ncbi:hypothetical protein BKA65DRAFT_179564 [Rhexocercosporidium sp. MPI-PUGE-AT-0058]|nr:hypothetical protein BKA65DRAFT_179564 [Rhexocercosporidium sp. MPI-PUGE-AT-0058]